MKIYDDYVWPEFLDLAHDILPVKDREPDWTEDSYGQKAIGIKWSEGPGRESFIEPLLLDEMHRLSENGSSDWQQERLDAMAYRMERLTSYMTWQALRGKLVVNYPDNASIQISYPTLPELRPTFTTPWTDQENANPMRDLDSFLNRPDVIERFGPEPRVVMNSRTANRGMKCKLAMTMEYMTSRFVEICDQGFRTEEQDGEAQYIQFIEEGEIWVFPKEEKPGYVANMPVEIADDEEADHFWEGMGPFVGEFEMKGPDGESLGTFMRVSSMRIPVIDHPEWVARITAYTPEEESA